MPAIGRGPYTPDVEHFDVIVIGSGACGLTVARGLSDAGRGVLVVDKGKRPGGRMASRPVGQAIIDTGAPDAACTSAEALAEILQRAGDTVRTTTVGDRTVLAFAESAGATARHWADSLEVRTELITHLERLSATELAVVPRATDTPVIASTVVMTAPFPQSMQLLAASGFSAAMDVHADYERRMLLLVRVEAFAAPDPGATTGMFTVRQVATDADGSVAMVLVVDPEWAMAAWDDDTSIVHARLLLGLRDAMPEGRVLWSDVKQWRYANAVRTVDAPFVRTSDPAVVVGGDAFGDATYSGLERAVLSGLRIVDLLR